LLGNRVLVESDWTSSEGSDVNTNVIKISFMTEILQSVYTKITVKNHLSQKIFVITLILTSEALLEDQSNFTGTGMSSATGALSKTKQWACSFLIFIFLLIF
jgi:hypothetical protein